MFMLSYPLPFQWSLLHKDKAKRKKFLTFIENIGSFYICVGNVEISRVQKLLSRLDHGAFHSAVKNEI
jgi:hypothetical protein